MKDFDDFTGPAADCLEGNKFANVLKAIAYESNIPEQNHAKT